MLVEAARTMLIFSKSPLFLWVEAIATACYTQNRSLIHTHYDKTPYELLIDHKLELKYLHIFGALCYLTNNFEDLGKLQSKEDIGIFTGYSPSNKASHAKPGSTLAKPPTKNDWDLLFQPMLDEYFKNPSVASNLISAATLPLPDTAGAFSSFISIDKNAPLQVLRQTMKQQTHQSFLQMLNQMTKLQSLIVTHLPIHFLLQTPAQLHHL
uniref:Retrovirus-related Pol polyprotein from transposon TNT 1-94 n=1 Tax=Tanacetum cinerariifolium TaxID=118510 RepID=A0A699JNW8_TANCI|nr:retrovirus-related Pol polyprotein from transposon TNT 1-94 [Tanacetum cinerariifolium]